MDTLIYRGKNAEGEWVTGLLANSPLGGQLCILISPIFGYPKEEFIEIDPATLGRCMGHQEVVDDAGEDSGDNKRMALVFEGDIVRLKSGEFAFISYETMSMQPIPAAYQHESGQYRRNSEQGQFLLRQHRRQGKWILSRSPLCIVGNMVDDEHLIQEQEERWDREDEQRE